MDEMYGFHPTANDYAADDKILTSPENLTIPADYETFSSDYHRIPMFESEELITLASAISKAASITRRGVQARPGDEDRDDTSSVIRAKIASHPKYPQLVEAYIDCQKLGAPPEIASLLDGIRLENHACQVSMCLGVDPELDRFMETFCDVLVKYKSDLSRPFDEATTFLNNIEMQLGDICIDEGSVSSDEEFSGDTEVQDQELKDILLRKYGDRIGSLKREFSKKKKKGKLPKEARQTLLDWWNAHYKWPYPTEADKIVLAESTGLNQKQINNWFINQRKRHWKPAEDMQLAAMDNHSGQFSADD